MLLSTVSRTRVWDEGGCQKQGKNLNDFYKQKEQTQVFDDNMPRFFTPKNKCGWLDIKSEKRAVLFPTKIL